MQFIFGLTGRSLPSFFYRVVISQINLRGIYADCANYCNSSSCCFADYWNSKAQTVVQLYGNFWLRITVFIRSGVLFCSGLQTQCEADALNMVGFFFHSFYVIAICSVFYAIMPHVSKQKSQ
tara:strand:- start:288 stop:653 length:366 start_codon:yes stop_codon:yes gene_type:complete